MRYGSTKISLNRHGMVIFFMAVYGLLGISTGFASTTNNVIGTYASWPTNWVALNSLNDPTDGVAHPESDFVGDTTNSGAYYARNSDYVFFRMRVQIDTVIPGTTFHNAHFVLINLIGSNYVSGALQAGTDDGNPDYAFTWDSKSNDNTKHGLEMSVRSVIGVDWKSTRMDDVDGDAGKKGTNDINGLISGSTYRTTDGYVRTIDQAGTTNFGMTTVIDYAVKWSYLQTYTGLTSNQQWRVALASIDNATDHNPLTTDIAGGATPSSLVTQGWSTVYSTPTSSGMALHAYQAMGGTYVEFVAYDVANEGVMLLSVLDAAGQVVWTGETNVTACARLTCRFLVPDLAVGGTYNFAVRDEAGTGWSAPGVTVTPFAAEMIHMSATGATLSFNSLPAREYAVQWVERLGAPWQTVTQVVAVATATRVFVAYPDPKASSGFFRVLLK